MTKDFELIRIGKPLLPEFAAWRYGSRFTRRWRESWFAPTSGVAGTVAGVATGTVVGFAASLFVNPLVGVTAAAMTGVPAAIVGWLRHARRRGEQRLTWIPSGASIAEPITGADSYRARVHEPTESAPWSISIIHTDAQRREYEGPIARRILGSLLMHVNWRGATRNVTGSALDILENAPARDDPVGSLAAHLSEDGVLGGSPIADLPAPVQLALEMAVNEDLERPALDGRLAELEQAWREAEEIAAIADDLFSPPAIGEQLARMRGRNVG